MRKSRVATVGAEDVATEAAVVASPERAKSLVAFVAGVGACV